VWFVCDGIGAATIGTRLACRAFDLIGSSRRGGTFPKATVLDRTLGLRPTVRRIIRTRWRIADNGI